MSERLLLSGSARALTGRDGGGLANSTEVPQCSFGAGRGWARDFPAPRRKMPFRLSHGLVLVTRGAIRRFGRIDQTSGN